MKPKRALIGILALLAGCFTIPAQAELIPYHFTGSIASQSYCPQGCFTSDQMALYPSISVFGDLTVNTAVLDRDPSADRDTYAGVLTRFNGIVPVGIVLDSTQPDNSLTVLHTPTADQFTMNVRLHQYDWTGYEWDTNKGPLTPNLFTMTWEEAPSAGGSFPSLGSIANGQYRLQWADGVRAYDITGHIANLTPVPMPAAVWLFGAGIGVLGWLRYRAWSI